MPAAPAVEELGAAGPQGGKEMLEIGRGGRNGAEGGRVGWSAGDGEQADGQDPACDLEPPIGDVPVWDAIADEVECRAEQDG